MPLPLVSPFSTMFSVLFITSCILWVRYHVCKLQTDPYSKFDMHCLQTYFVESYICRTLKTLYLVKGESWSKQSQVLMTRIIIDKILRQFEMDG